MKGLPEVLATRADWINAAEYVKKHTQLKLTFRTRLEGLLAKKTCKMLKPGVTKAADELTPDDFEDVTDPASALARCGLTETEINGMISEL